MRPGSFACNDGDARSIVDTPDDPAEYAVPRDGVPDGLPAPHGGGARARRDAGRCVAAAVSSALLRTARRAHGRGAAPPRAQGRAAWSMPPSIAHFLAHAPRYVETVEPAIRFLQRRDPSLRAADRRAHVPARGPRFALPPRAARRATSTWPGRSARSAPRSRRATSRASIVDDLADVWRVGHRSALRARALRRAARGQRADVRSVARRRSTPSRRSSTKTLDELTRELVAAHQPDVVGMTAPFPGNVYGAFRMARAIRAAVARTTSSCSAAAGSTRSCAASRAARVRLLRLRDARRRRAAAAESARAAAQAATRRSCARIVRRGRRRGARNRSDAARHPAERTPAPRRTTACRSDDYVSVLEMLNPMHRLWSDGRWNKITLAHGCYWKKCTFCDVSLDYIGRYDRPAADVVMQRIRALIAETGETGFHLVDEAAPPAGAARAREAAHRREAQHHVVGQHPLREDVHARALRAAGRVRLRGGQRRPRGRVRPAARSSCRKASRSSKSRA